VSRGFARVTRGLERGESFRVVKRGVTLGTIVPEKKKKKYTLEDLWSISFKGGKNLSKEIDEIVYGIKRPHRR
jgi:hypothetical protein